MSASTSPKETPASSSDREASSSPDDGDARAKPADFAVRFGARVIDTIVGVGVGIGVAFGTGVVLGSLVRSGALAPSAVKKVSELSLGTFGWSFLGTMAYHTLSESIGGASVGKWICGLRVYSADFSPDGTFLVGLRRCTVGGALVRSLALMIDTLFFASIAYFSMAGSRWQQRLGDKWGHTLVVKAKSTDLPPRSPIPGMLVGLLAWGAFLALALVLKVL
jgi:uncharacterized RDD family membrane protein YckC